MKAPSELYHLAVSKRRNEEMDGNITSEKDENIISSCQQEANIDSSEREIITRHSGEEPRNACDENIHEDDPIEYKENVKNMSHTSLNSIICDVSNSIISWEPVNDSQNIIIKSLLKKFRNLLLGPFTPQKFCGMDVTSLSLSEFYEIKYRPVVESVLQKYSPKWINEEIEDLITNMIIIDGSSCILLHGALSVLIDVLKDSKTPRMKVEFVIGILEKLVKSEAIASAVLQQCSNMSWNFVEDERRAMMMKNQGEQLWLETAQMIVSLPSRVANKMKHEPVHTFRPDAYCRILCFHIAKCIQFLVNVEDLSSVDFQPLSTLFSKTISNFSTNIDSCGIFKLTEIFEFSCRNETYRKIVISMFLMLNNEVIERICKIIFSACSKPSSVKNILGNIVFQKQIWRHVLCNKLLLMSYQNWEDSKIVENLIGYLFLLHLEQSFNKSTDSSLMSEKSVNNRILIDVLANLLTVWSDRSALNHTPLEQHIYITQAIILCLSYLTNPCGSSGGLSESDKRSIESKIYSGIPAHLESPHTNFRVVGMITAELVINDLRKSDDKELPKLNFEYEDSPLEAKRIITALKKLHDRGQEVYQLDPKEDSFNNYLTEDELFMMLQSDNHVSNPNKEIPKAVQEQEEKELITSKNKKTNVNPADEDSDNNETEEDQSDVSLDSDDDIAPFNVVHDVKLTAKKRPKYLRDLMTGLLETEDHEKFEESMEVCEDMIKDQLPDDDASLGIELLEMLISLEEKFYTDNFDDKRFSACVAIVTIYPVPCAEYLCAQLNSGFRHYSISHMMFILDCLAGGAKKLSSIEPKEIRVKRRDSTWTSSVKPSKSNKVVQSSVEDIIKKRIESHTRRFASSPISVTSKVNAFCSAGGSFFFPLVYGFCQNTKKDSFWSNLYKEQDCVLLVHFLHTVAVIMTAAVHCPIAVRMGKELLDLCWNLHYHPEAKVRLAVMSCIGAVVVVVPKVNLMSDLQDALLECRLWLVDVTSTKMRNNEPDAECRQFAAYLVILIENMIGANLLSLMQDN